MKTRRLNLFALIVVLVVSISGSNGAFAQDAPDGSFLPITPDNVGRLDVILDSDYPGDFITWVSVSPDGQLLTYDVLGGNLILWDIVSNIEKIDPVNSGVVVYETFSPDGTLLAFVAEESLQTFTLHLWDVRTLSELAVVSPPGLGADSRFSIVFSPDSQYLAAVGEEGQVWLWETSALRSGALDPALTVVDCHTNEVAFSTDGTMLAISSGSYSAYNADITAYEFIELENAIHVWNLAEHSEVVTITSDLGAGIQGIAFSPDGTLLAAAVCSTGIQDECYGSAVRLWNAADGTLLRTLVDYEADIAGRFFALGPVFSPDGTTLAIGTRLWDASGEVHFWDPVTGERQAAVPGSEPVYFNADGSLVAFASGEELRWLVVWDTATWQGVYAYDVEPEKHLATGMWNQDGTLIVFPAVGGGSTQIVALGVPGAAQAEEEVASAPTYVNHIRGVSAETIEARLGDGPETCAIEAGEALLATARSSANDLLVYAGGLGCEGVVWIPAASGDWDETANLTALATIPGPEPYEQLPPLDYLPEGWQVCTDAQGWAPFPDGAPKLTVQQVNERTREQARNLIPAEYLATRPEEVNVLLCEGMRKIPYQTCYYTGGVTATRMRYDRVMMLVNYETGGIIAETTYPGGDPDPCPQYVSAGGDLPGLLSQVGPETWAVWAVEQLDANAQGSHTGRRTVANVDALNARAEPNTESEILQRLAFGTPVNLIARNEAGDWVVALLPDMSQAWLFVDLLQVAPQTDISALPVAEGPAVDVVISSPRP